MDYSSLHMKTVADLRKIAKDAKIKVPAGTTKLVLVQMILEHENGQKIISGEPAKAAPDAIEIKKPAPSAEPQPVQPSQAPSAELQPVRKPQAPSAEPQAVQLSQAPSTEPQPIRTPQAPSAEPQPVQLSQAPSAEPKSVQTPQAPDKPIKHARARKTAEPTLPTGTAERSVPEPKALPETPEANVAAADQPVHSEQEPVNFNQAIQAEPTEDKPKAVQDDAERTETSAYHRPMSTQQRMGARTQGVQNAYRAPMKPGMVNNRTGGRFNTETSAPRGPRNYDAQPYRRTPNAENTPPYRKPNNMEGVPQYRRPVGSENPQANRGPSNPESVQSYRNANNPEGAPIYRNFGYPETAQPNRGLNTMENGQAYRSGSGMNDAAAYRRGETPEYTQPYRGQEDSPHYYRPINPEEDVQIRRPLQYDEEPQGLRSEEPRTLNPGVPELLATGECGDGAGILEIHQDGYGFLRAENYLPGNKDVYVSAAQIRRFNLRTGDYVVGKTRAQQAGDRSVGLIFINEVNGQSPDLARGRRPFDTLVPVYPNERLRMETPESNDISLRLIDMLAPIGKGQRGMIVSQPKAGKTTLLKKIANAITVNNPDVHLIVLLIDERPEEVTDMKRSIQGEVVYSTFDEAPENHARVSEMVLERAQRLVELGKDVVVLLDSITRLARAYNLVIPPTGRSLSGGLDPGALYKPKRFFGAARNIENGGSLTIIATALVDTGSRMDDIIFEEFKGTGNMELHLDRSLSDRRIFPAIDVFKSGTRREELLLTPAELDGAYLARKMLAKGSAQESAEQMISLMQKTKTNQEFFGKIKGWLNVCEKDGFR